MKLNKVYNEHGIGAIRIILGGLLFYHGIEIFDHQTMKIYLGWDQFKGTFGVALAYIGKASELIAGVMLILGFHTRTAGLLTAGTFLYITFIVDDGQFWYANQHPFLFALLGLLFFFIGSGSWAVDTKRKKD